MPLGGHNVPKCAERGRKTQTPLGKIAAAAQWNVLKKQGSQKQSHRFSLWWNKY